MKALLLILSFLMVSQAGFAKGNEKKKVLMLISTGFYAPEYFKPRELFEKEGFIIDVAAKYDSPVTPDQRQINTHPAVKPNVIFKDVDVAKYDAIVFAGGNGAWEDFFPNEDVHKILTEALNASKTVALLCSATGLLGVANNLDGEGTPVAKGRKVTGYSRVAGLLKVLGQVDYHAGEKDKPFVMVDGNLITGRDPISSELFAQAVIKALN